MDDRELLRQFVEERSQHAFRELVSRHTDWLHSVCLRRLRDPSLAEDATQAVFIALARRSRKLLKLPVLSPWLFKAARYVALNLQRARNRRTHHESEAAHMVRKALSADETWHAVECDLEPALDLLSARDRKLILLRFYEKKTHAQIAATLRISEAAAQKGLSRALERLRDKLAHNKDGRSDRFAALTIPLLGASLQSHAVGTAPHALSSSIAAALVSPSSHLAHLARGILKAAALAKAKAVAVVVALAVTISILSTFASSGQEPPKPPLSIGVASEPATQAVLQPLEPKVATTFDADTFLAMSNDQRFAFVAARLGEREKLLENLAFTVQEDVQNPNADGSRHVIRRSFYELRRSGNSFWMHSLEGSAGAIGSYLSDSTYSWDGKTQRRVSPPSLQRDYVSAGIADKESYVFSSLEYNRILGIRIRDLADRNGTYEFKGTLTQWLELHRNLGTVIAITLEPDRQTIKLEMEITNPALSRRQVSTWISTTQGFMISRQQLLARGGNQSYALLDFQVRDAAEQQGVWMPMHIIRANSVGDETTQRLEQEFIYTARDFQLHGVTPEDLEVQFPPQTHVMDTIRKINYTINDDGTFTLLKFVDAGPMSVSANGIEQVVTIYQPPENPVVSFIDDSTGALYTTRPGQ